MEGIPDFVWEYIRAAGAAGVLLAWVLLERRERIEQRKLYDQRLKELSDESRSDKTEATLAIQRIYDLLNAGRK